MIQFKRLTLLALMLLALLPANAVLKERDMKQTLSVLRTELESTHHEQLVRMQRFNEMNRRFDKMMLQVMDRSQQIELMLYSQKSNYVFDLAYACNEATQLYDRMSARMLPFDVFAKQYNDQVTQYVHLVQSLEGIPDYLLTTPQMRADRDSCAHLADIIAHDMAVQQVQIEKTQERSKAILAKAKLLNEFAMQAYDDIRRNIFVNGGDSYFSIMQNMPRHWRQAKYDLTDKYRPTGKTHSDWRGNLILFLFLFILSYVVITGTVSTIVIRYLIPKRWTNKAFLRKRKGIIIAASAALFAIITLVISLTLQSHNFMIMASRLLSEYAWLLVVIMLSLLIRLDGDNVMSGIRLYTPITVVGLVVFIYRITFMPNTMVNLTFPSMHTVAVVGDPKAQPPHAAQRHVLHLDLAVGHGHLARHGMERIHTDERSGAHLVDHPAHTHPDHHRHLRPAAPLREEAHRSRRQPAPDMALRRHLQDDHPHRSHHEPWGGHLLGRARV